MSAVPPSISAVLPAFNEAAVIADTVVRTHRALRRHGVTDHQVIVVDDGSSDGTGDVVRRVAAELPATVLLVHPRNLGYGAALRTGFEAARCEAVWLLDSDGQFDPADLGRLLAAWAPGTLVAGHRSPRCDPWGRRAGHDVFFGLVRALTGPTLRDVNCAFKLFPRELGTGLRARGAMVSTELALRARDRGCATVEVPIPHHPRTTGSATGARPQVVARAVVELWGMRATTPRRRPVPTAESPAPTAESPLRRRP
jgi:glycosyltransferase involved in cell wall biosynthesis